jgi:hypothetical protein
VLGNFVEPGDTETKDTRVQQRAAESVDFTISSLEAEKERALMDKLEKAQAAPQMLEGLTSQEVKILDKMGSRTLQRVKTS